MRNAHVCTLAIVMATREGQKKTFFEIQKKWFLNPGKSAKNIF